MWFGWSDIVRFWANVGDPDENGCRGWLLYLNDQGYGQFQVDGQSVGPHRVAFYLANGYWAEETRHSCDNPSCCEPTHLLDGTRSDNQLDCVARGRHPNANKIECPKGHPYDEANTYVHPTKGSRICRQCTRDRQRERKAA